MCAFGSQRIATWLGLEFSCFFWFLFAGLAGGKKLSTQKSGAEDQCIRYLHWRRSDRYTMVPGFSRSFRAYNCILPVDLKIWGGGFVYRSVRSAKKPGSLQILFSR